MNKLLALGILVVSVIQAFAQETFPVNGVKDERTRAYGFTNATIFVDHQTTLENATLVIRDGKIENVGANVSVPEGYTEVDLTGKYIYPGLIDIYTTYGIPEVKGDGRGWGRPEQIPPKTEGAYNANDAIKSQYNAFDEFTVEKKSAGSLRKLGFGSVLSYRPDGLARGSSVFVSLGEDTENKVMLNSRAASHYSFSKGTSQQSYPVSTMGYIAVLRQTYLDADWYGRHSVKPFTDKSLDGWISLQSLPQIFETSGWMTSLRADKVGDEFGVQYIIVGGGDEYQRINEIKQTNASYIIPLDFPEPYEVDDPIDTEAISLEQMKHWELAPTNPGVLEQNNISFALTAHDLKDKKKFWENLRKAIEHGLSESEALKALTYNPASMLRMSDRIGSLRNGHIANFLITSDSLFKEDVKIYDNWIQGVRYKVTDPEEVDYNGIYELSFNDMSYDLEVSGEPGKHKARINLTDTPSVNVKLNIADEQVTMSFNPDEEEYESDFRLSGWFVGDQVESGLGWKGRGQDPDGDWVDWLAEYQQPIEEEEDEKSEEEEEQEKSDRDSLGAVIYPFLAYGMPELPEQETILIKNATVWTNESDGILENMDVLLQNGKIARVGKNLDANNAKVIDGTGKHVTPGIIDEHSHIAASSINDVAANSGMVRIGDVVNSETISIYRALAGGVTAIQILHGSANPIGGQSALIKMRWGSSPEQLKISGADEFIKFALGENVKRARGGNSVRYPGTRMGVEQVYMDAFSAARDYQQKWQEYNNLSQREKTTVVPPRRDLAMEAMLEILNGERFISCHSYRQSEINMLMKVAEKFDFRINTFTHILEGYKVADKMAQHGAGGSTFSDWWAYKWEVRYAIPYNAAIMDREGVVTAINSDNSEMLRRLNQEAAKAVKYGGIPEEDAFKMVTLNPAKLLHLDDRMGSIQRGKDADVVVWSDHPLSIYAKVEQTIVDGKIYFDLEKDQQLREWIRKERARLIAKMREAGKKGKKTQKSVKKTEPDFHCEDIIEID